MTKNLNSNTTFIYLASYTLFMDYKLRNEVERIIIGLLGLVVSCTCLKFIYEVVSLFISGLLAHDLYRITGGGLFLYLFTGLSIGGFFFGIYLFLLALTDGKSL